MEKEILEDILVFVGIVTAMGCFTGIMITWLKWRGSKRLGNDVTQRLNDITAQLARLEATSESSAIEIERMSEAQRFTTKLLADRTEAGVPRS